MGRSVVGRGVRPRRTDGAVAPAAGAGRTVAIVDAFDDPTAEADLGVYRSQFGLPACTTANGCFRRVGQTGTSARPRKNAVAVPNTGVAVYDSTPFQGFSGWLVFGGTSASAPIIASVYGLAGNAATIDANDFPYQHSTSLFDVTTGSNGTCSPAPLCTARAGWDGPTGLGTPNGTGAF